VSDPNSLSAEPATPEMIRDGIARLVELMGPPSIEELDRRNEMRALGTRLVVEQFARRTPLGIGRETLVNIAATLGVGRDVVDAQPPPAPWVDIPPPIQRQGEAIEKRRQKRRAHAKMRQRRRGDRAGRPL